MALLTTPDHELFNPSNLDELEQHVATQMSNGFCDSRINRAIIRLYALHPKEQKEEIIVNILALSLIALPEPDFLTTLCMIPQSLHDTEGVKGLVEVESLLQTGRFSEFWARTTQSDVAGVLANVTGFAAAVRKFMITALLITYKSIKVSALRRSLDLQDAAPLCAERGWEVSGDGDAAVIEFPSNSENQAKPMAVKDAATFTDVSHLMQLLSK